MGRKPGVNRERNRRFSLLLSREELDFVNRRGRNWFIGEVIREKMLAEEFQVEPAMVKHLPTGYIFGVTDEGEGKCSVSYGMPGDLKLEEMESISRLALLAQEAWEREYPLGLP